jgi:peptide/nickel transport system substrate-binding protein
VPAFAGTDQANLALALGDVDWAGNFVPAIERVFVDRDRDHHEYWFPPVGGTVVMYANTARAPFGDVRLRKALSLAVDRNLIVDVAMYGYTRPADATGLSDAYAQWKNNAIGDGGWVRLDRKLAGRLLDEAGFRASPDGVRVGPNGAPLRMTQQTVSGWPDWARAAQVIVQDLRKVGVVVDLKTYDFGAYFDRLQRGDYELSLGWTPEGPTPYHFYRGLMASSTVRPLGERAAENWNRFANKDVDALLAQFERTSDVEEQRRIVGALSRRFAEQAPVIPLFLSVSWGECNTRRFRGFPSAKRPYARLAPYIVPECLLVLTALEPAAGGRAVA